MQLRILVAPDSFKGSVEAADVARSISEGWRSVASGDCIERPMADGGEGTLNALALAVPGARRMPVNVTGPDDRPTQAAWLLLPADGETPHGIGAVELASTSGIEMLGDRLRPIDAHTLGFGEAISDALDHGVSRLLLALGSSSSTDGGVGMLRALGGRFLDADGSPVALGIRGLEQLHDVDIGDLRPIPRAGVTVLSDVVSPLLGARGAATVFGPQKGLAGSWIRRADAALAHLASFTSVDPQTPGAGAAGGTGFGAMVWGATMASGAGEVSRLIGLHEEIARADLVVTGEGLYDGQSDEGKAPSIVRSLAAASGVPVALIAGGIAAGADLSGFVRTYSLTALAGSAERAMEHGPAWIRQAGSMLAESWRDQRGA